MPDHPERQQSQRAAASPSEGIDKDALRKRIRIVLFLVLVVAVVLGAWGIVSRIRSRSELKNRTTADAEVTVITTKPQLSGAGDELVLPGTVSAYVEAPIYARTSG